MKKLSVFLMSIILSIALIGCGKAELPVTLDDIKDASEVLQDVAEVSELREVKSPLGNDQQIFLKLENTQPINSFKLRGAYYMISKLTPDQLEKGLCTCSAGNHAQGVGLAADHFGCEATIYVPSTTPEMKLERIRAYKNVTLKIIDGSFDDAKAACLADEKATGKIYIPPYDNKDVIAGQGTVGLEIMNQLPDADAVVVPVGGGGLASGVLVAVKTINPDCRVYAVEPENAASMKASIEAGKPVELPSAKTIADGTAVKKPGDITYQICSSLCDGFITVSEDDIKSAIAYLYIEEGITAEGAGALSTAAVMTGQIPSDCKKVVCIVSGSNIDPSLLQEILEEAGANLTK
ncbi:MAG: threonine/serine dehydratase [Lachnospiraceae bacterium]|nr:threonine/serine dehydratase [Lachnospiraceae bacterium]